MNKITFLLILTMPFFSVAQEAFSPSKAAKDPNYLNNFGKTTPFEQSSSQPTQYEPPIPATVDMDVQTLPNEPQPNEVQLPPPPPEPIFTKGATFTVINKRTARKETFTLPMGISIVSEKLEINPVKCYIDEAKTPPEHGALVEIFAPNNKSARELFYSGWLLSNHPQASFMAHPQYDVTLDECIKDMEIKQDDAENSDTHNSTKP